MSSIVTDAVASGVADESGCIDSSGINTGKASESGAQYETID